ncbi:MAG TPA: GtrA family protein [Ruminococcus sp.]|nr:GtrA family protein [Ruminococcus sp.]
MKDSKDHSEKSLNRLIRYGCGGVATTLLNIFLYQFLLLFLDYKISNLISIVLSKIFAYTVNKNFVFHSKCRDRKELLSEILRFIVMRGATGLIDYFGLIAAVEIFGLNKVWSKYLIQLIVIILNYILGKKAVFIAADHTQDDE